VFQTDFYSEKEAQKEILLFHFIFNFPVISVTLILTTNHW